MSSLIIVRAKGWVHILNRHVQSFAGASVEEGIDVDLFIIIIDLLYEL
jgi:hypothetical protein